ncbi:hypothetical protein, partial [Clostridioides difficile]
LMSLEIDTQETSVRDDTLTVDTGTTVSDTPAASTDTSTSSDANGGEPSSLLEFVTKAVPDLEITEEGDDLLNVSKDQN